MKKSPLFVQHKWIWIKIQTNGIDRYQSYSPNTQQINTHVICNGASYLCNRGLQLPRTQNARKFIKSKWICMKMVTNWVETSKTFFVVSTTITKLVNVSHGKSKPQNQGSNTKSPICTWKIINWSLHKNKNNQKYLCVFIRFVVGFFFWFIFVSLVTNLSQYLIQLTVAKYSICQEFYNGFYRVFNYFFHLNITSIFF